MPEECQRNSNATRLGVPDFSNRAEAFRWAVKRMEQQQIATREEVRAEMKAAVVPLPAEIVTKLAQLNPRDVRDVLIDHPGFKAWERLGSYRISLSVFERALSDLIRVIERFEAAAEGDILDPRQRDALEDIEQALQKELFSATNAALSLVDHSTRRLQPHVNIPGYTAKLAECFGADGLHEFVQGLRILLYHLHEIKAGWRFENHFEKGKKASFTLKRDHVRLIIESEKKTFTAPQRAGIRAYLSASPDVIDLKRVFGEYQRRAANFHAWYGEALASDSLMELRDCERCFRESKNYGACTSWKAMLGNWLNWQEPPNPYDHLHRHLTPEQIDEVYRLPMQSEEQVDKVIEFMDANRACDADLRKMVYQLFRRAPSRTEPT